MRTCRIGGSAAARLEPSTCAAGAFPALFSPMFESGAQDGPLTDFWTCGEPPPCSHQPAALHRKPTPAGVAGAPQRVGSVRIVPADGAHELRESVDGEKLGGVYSHAKSFRYSASLLKGNSYLLPALQRTSVRSSVTWAGLRVGVQREARSVSELASGDVEAPGGPPATCPHAHAPCC